MTNIKRGEVYMADLEVVDGSVQHGYRPVVIVQNNIGNKHAATTIIVPITTKKENKWYMPTHVKVNRMKELDSSSKAICEQIITISKARLKKRVGSLNRRKMIEINLALAISILPGCVQAICQMYKIKNRFKDMA